MIGPGVDGDAVVRPVLQGAQSVYTAQWTMQGGKEFGAGQSVCVAAMCWLAVAVFPLVAWAQSPGAEPDPADPELDASVHIEEIEPSDVPTLEGRKVVGFDFRCDLELCHTPETAQRFKQMSGLSVGDTYSAKRVERAQRRLAMTGFFRELSVERRLVDGGVYIEIEALGAVLIRRIEFEGLSPPPFESELRKVLMYRSGQVFHDDADQANAQLRSLKALFEQEGYFGTRIELKPEPVEGEPHLVDLVFEVDVGIDRRICALAFRGVRGMTVAEARELMLDGVSILSRRIPLFLPMYTSDQFRHGREALIAEYRRRGYFRARIIDQAVQIDEDTNCARLIVDVNEGPYWDIQFRGNDSVSAQRLRDALPFAETGYVDDDEIRMAQNAVRQVYEAQGYPFAQVQGRQEVEDRLDRRLIFEIDEGPQAQIEDLRFHGVEAIDHDEVRSAFRTRPFGFFDTGGYLLTEQLLVDLSRLERRYREIGYMGAVVERFAVELHDGEEQITVHIFVDEGARTDVDAVDLSGYGVLSESDLRERLDIEAGGPFIPLKVQADQARLTQHYGSIGYPQATVETTCWSGDGREVPCQAPRMPEDCERSTFDELADQGCRWDDDESRTWVCERISRDDHCQYKNGVVDEVVSVRHQISEGSKVRVGQILLKGNFRTRPGVIFRELPLETGDVMDVQKLIEGQGNMRSLAIFDSVSIETIGLDDPEFDDEADSDDEEPDEQIASLIVSVEESQARFVDFRYGFEGREILDESRRLLATGELQYTDQNLFGTGQRFRPRIIGAADALELYELGLDTTREPDVAGDVRNLDYLFGAELIYNHPRFLRGQLGVDELHLTVTPFYLIDQLGVSTDRVRREEWGLRLELRKELHEVMDRFFLTFGVEAKQAATWASGDLRVDGERIFSPRRATGKLMPELTLDRRDSPLNPREGFHVQFQPELVSGDALAHSGEEMIGDSYWRLSLSASVFWRLTEELTLGQGVHLGQVVPVFDRQRMVPPDERFYLGGVGSVRGFPANTLGPVGSRQDPTGGEFLLNYNAELRYPLMEDWGLYGATFFDAGVLVDCFDDQGRRSSGQCVRNAFPEDGPLQRVRASAGLGVRYLLAGQIPLLLDYGMVLNRRPAERFGSLHFNLGYTF